MLPRNHDAATQLIGGRFLIAPREDEPADRPAAVELVADRFVFGPSGFAEADRWPLPRASKAPPIEPTVIRGTALPWYTLTTGPVPGYDLPEAVAYAAFGLTGTCPLTINHDRGQNSAVVLCRYASGGRGLTFETETVPDTAAGRLLLKLLRAGECTGASVAIAKGARHRRAVTADGVPYVLVERARLVHIAVVTRPNRACYPGTAVWAERQTTWRNHASA
jgi:hypothetical protein